VLLSDPTTHLYKPLNFLNVMEKITIKGHEISPIKVTNTHLRRATQFKNKIIAALSPLGLTEDDIDIPIEQVAIRKTPATASWYLEGYHLHFSYQGMNFAENMYIIYKVIETEVNMLLEEKKTLDQFIADFSEDSDIKKQRKEARELLGVKEDESDFNIINEKFKHLAKDAHPDKGGNIEHFKALNRAHKILKRELQ
jgi:hypothetical protein